ncbi:hypothetical protein [Sphingomonas sp. S-NIH.Pt15_0812]|uniref:DUF6894 family protein n=1 Tax=Sphingomonas sp. S-NIH.Pt15_0812 TaxID=1920129 RepID=UPI000F7D7F0A|nr:hypothetical protein [Sphingomonas sp. S-NIH.Pt15_0812]
MPKYYFDLNDKILNIDSHGIIFENQVKARNEAVKFAGALIAEHAEDVWIQRRELIMVVKGEDNIPLFQLTFFATDLQSIESLQ